MGVLGGGCVCVLDGAVCVLGGGCVCIRWRLWVC